MLLKGSDEYGRVVLKDYLIVIFFWSFFLQSKKPESGLTLIYSDLLRSKTVHNKVKKSLVDKAFYLEQWSLKFDFLLVSPKSSETSNTIIQ